MTESPRRPFAVFFTAALLVSACSNSTASDDPLFSASSSEVVAEDIASPTSAARTDAIPEGRPRNYTSLDELMEDLAAGGLPCTDPRPIRTGDELDDPFQLAAGPCIRDQLTLQLFETPDVARTAGELAVAETWALLDEIGPGLAEPRHWVLGGNWVVLCVDSGTSCPAVQEILGGTIEVYDGPREAVVDAGTDEQVEELHSYLDGELFGCGPELRNGPAVYVETTQGFAFCLDALFEGLVAVGSGTPAQVDDDDDRIGEWFLNAVLNVAGTDDVVEAGECVGADDHLFLTLSVSADLNWYEISSTSERSCG